MSAIVAGTCKKCGTEFWVSLGHPKWFDNYVKRGIPSKEIEIFRKAVENKLCLNCDSTWFDKLTGYKVIHDVPQDRRRRRRNRERI